MIQSEYNELGNQRISQLSESEFSELKNFQNVCFWLGQSTIRLFLNSLYSVVQTNVWQLSFGSRGSLAE
ncbi:MAG: hypothetical protein DRR08_19770 [Candidatus Parabeggiatoa sp. nov. 2]|nr:MAG: hypothetical protein B6247_24165 [Beggiatoa sp. 4572_84]RKZ57144.1 MAG: hypothetical protein DRR08_19770 [Gammaproteobacteria bacterium]